MKTYTGFQWLLIDCANQFGLDKLTFEQRIEWSTLMLPDLESMADRAETKPLYVKAVMAIRKAQAGIPTGHMVGVDGCCSGIQVLSVLSGCAVGAESTGLVNPDVRADAYAKTTAVMQETLGTDFNISRADAKQALMCSFYGSKEIPKQLFGEDSPELSAFYGAAQTVAPGAWDALQCLLGAWQPYALEHSWKLPDGFDARVRVMDKKELRIEVDELDHATFSYEYYENVGMAKGISLPANVTHSVDGYIVRSMHRRCNYDHMEAIRAQFNISIELSQREQGYVQHAITMADTEVAYYIDQCQRSGIADAVILPYLQDNQCVYLSESHLNQLLRMVTDMLAHPPFELVTIHDEFKAHPNNIDQVRFHYKEILADLADSNLMQDILSQIHGYPGTFTKLSNNLGDLIRNSNYGLT